MKKRVGIVALLQENNTFFPERTQLKHFRGELLVEGTEVLQRFSNSHHEVGGFIESMANCSEIELVGVFAARAEPYGPISAECWNELMHRLEEAIKCYGPYDGLLVAPHGANVADNALDADGHWLRLVRNLVGPKIPIIGTLDLHANVSQEMVNSTNALFGYRTNPHLDQRECGLKAGSVMIETLRGNYAPVQSLIQLPLCPNIERQATSETHGRSLFANADQLVEHHPDLISVSCLYGFPYADVKHMGASVIAVAKRDRELARRCAQEVAAYWWSNRDAFIGQLISIDSAIELAQKTRRTQPSKPVGLLDMGDNVGGGGPGDATAIVHSWLSYGLREILTVIADPETVGLAFTAGVGKSLKAEVGGKADPATQGAPIIDTYTVCSLSDGKFREDGVTHGGYQVFDQGRTAVLTGTLGQTIVATTHRVGPMSIQQLLSQSIDPAAFAAIVIKGVHAPVAAYAPICSQLIRVNTDGVTTADLSRLKYYNRNRPQFPFEKQLELLGDF